MEAIKQARWLLFIRGIISLIFGLIVLFHPALSIGIFVLFFSVYVFIMGGAAIFYSFIERKEREDWWLLLIEGIIGVIAGIVVWIWPALSALMLLYVIAVWAIITGVMQLYTAIKFRKVILHDFWLGLLGILSILFGLYVIMYPGAGAIALAWLIGIYAILFGVMFILMGFSVNNEKSES